MTKPAQPEESFLLYGGRVNLLYRDSSHRYRVSEDGSKPESCPSVTTVLGVLAKPALILWGIRIACDYVEDNLKLLIKQNSFSEQDVFRIVGQARTAHDRARDEAAEIGTNVHDWLSAYWKGYLTGKCPPMPEEERTVKCINAALNWFQEHKIEPIAVESPQYSRVHKICGRPDLIARVDGELCVVDYKSTKALYPEVALQMCPYAMMHEEMNGQLPKARWGLRLDKESGEFEDRRYPPETFDQDWESFRACYLIYDRLKHLRRKPKKEKQEDLLAEV